MGWTNWQKPLITDKFETDEVDYQIIHPHNLQSNSRLVGVSTGYSQMRINGIDAMHFSGWSWPLKKVLGIEVKTHVSRLARITDLTVQLTQNKELVGKNLAKPYAEDVSVYGGRLHEWRLDDIDLSTVGLVLDFQPHPPCPSSELVYLRSVHMRVLYQIESSVASTGASAASLSGIQA